MYDTFISTVEFVGESNLKGEEKEDIVVVDCYDC